ncbi:MAG: translation elongation factor Ts [Candidatus Portnoybacteria bacterium CG10_big_fil_rev_8_21_14_0_10_44_7]|uniref:Elongation factor Ts n=1 Tax=Candidatus Portnoybacteria bacterium CG10_big_fil_rev_8_21_14_0_10_44_7 TaxID=1974816 RepID=A0A2M8KI96_9BACT|nr:MAG: translation elongation factor Ts [Candidatus Portnoybacteria bacterium CG10_big_fil_rev_8_21_14_0_10_44_7]
MEINAQLVKELRDQTGCSIGKCKEALVEAGGDMDKAALVLKKQGAKIAAKKADRQTGQGLIEAYIHGDGRVGVLLQLLCESDFVAKNDAFRELAHDIAMHIAAMDPQYISSQDVPAKVIDKEKEIFMEQIKKEGKPKTVAEKIVAGKLNKFLTEICLLQQPFIKDETQTVGKLIEQKIGQIGENIKVGQFTRFSI